MPNSKSVVRDVKITNRLGFIDLVKLSLRVFKTKLLRTILTIFGMSIGIGTVLILVSLGYGLQYILIGRLVTSEDSLITMEALFPVETGKNITAMDLDEITALPEVSEVSPIASFQAEIKHGDLAGLVPIEIVHNNYFRLAGVKPDIGVQFTEKKSGVVLSAQTMQLLSLPINQSSLGKTFDIKISYEDENTLETKEVALSEPVGLTGIQTDESLPPTTLIPSELIPLPPPFYRRVLVKAENINAVEPLKDKLIDKGYFISAKIDLVNQARGVLRAITITLGVFGITALFVAAIGMFNTMIVGFLERIYEVGIMKSLGATDRDIRNLFLVESPMLGFLGGLGGVIIGVGLGQLSNLGISILSKRLGGEAIQLFITPIWFAGVIIFASVIIGLIAGFWPAHKATTLSPKAAFIRK